MQRMPVADFWAINCQHAVMEWLGEDGQNVRNTLNAHKDDLPAFEKEQIALNDEFAMREPLNIVEDVDFNKRVVLVFFSQAIQAGMDRNEQEFEEASEEIFAYFEGLGRDEKAAVMNNAFQMYSQIRSAHQESDAAPAEGNDLTGG